MEKNKSIDGLSTRRSKSPATKSLARKSVASAPVRRASTPRASASARRPSSRKPSVRKSAPSQDIVVKNTTPTAIGSIQADSRQTIPNPKPVKVNATEDFLSPVQAFDFDQDTGDLKASAKKPTPKPDSVDSDIVDQEKGKKPKKEKKPVSKKRKIITSIILVIVLLLLGGVTWLVLWGNDIIAKITGGQGNIFDLVKFIEPTYEPLKTDENGRTNILAFGTSGYNMDGDEGNGVHDGAQLTDSIMVISLNQETGDIAMLSLPRDLKATPTCTATGKINEVYWCKGGKGNATIEEEATAANALMSEVSSIVGVDFQYFAHINWASLIQIVDTLGGIKVTLDEGIYDYYYTGAVFDPGVEYTINGEQALGLARARHGTTGGDFSRGASQQKILIGIKDKLMEKDLSITDYLSLASALGDNLRTNFSLEELKSMAHLTFDLDFDSMRQISLLDYANGIRYMTTGTINGISYVLPSAGVGNYTAIKAYVAKLLSNDPRSYEEPTILVLNGTGEVGVAGTEKTKLEEAGYTSITTDNAPDGDYPDKVTLYAVSTEKPGTKQLLEKFYDLHVSTDPLPEGFPTGYDFVILLGGEKPATEASEESSDN